VTPDKVKSIIKTAFPEGTVVAKDLTDGYSFFYLEVVDKGEKSTRLVRATQRSPTARLEFKVSVTSRRERKEKLLPVSTEAQVIEAVRSEIKLWEKHYGGADKA